MLFSAGGTMGVLSLEYARLFISMNVDEKSTRNQKRENGTHGRTRTCTARVLAGVRCVHIHAYLAHNLSLAKAMCQTVIRA